MKLTSVKTWVMRREFLAFVLAGGINTLVTYGVYLALLSFMPYPIAYSSSYITGIFSSYYLNARVVFKEPLRVSKALQYPLVYIVQYFVGLALLYLLIEGLRVSKELAPISVVLVSVPLTFVMSRYVIRRGSKPKEPGEASPPR